MLTAEHSSELTDQADGSTDRVDLSGSWRLLLDRRDAGEDERWYAADLTHDSSGEVTGGDARAVTLPGSLQEQGYGDEVTVETEWTGEVVDRSFYTDDRYAPYREPGRVSVPFWLQPSTHYRGAAWYQRSVEVPAAWAGRRVVLELEPVHWESTLWVNTTRAGTDRRAQRHSPPGARTPSRIRALPIRCP